MVRRISLRPIAVRFGQLKLALPRLPRGTSRNFHWVRLAWWEWVRGWLRNNTEAFRVIRDGNKHGHALPRVVAVPYYPKRPRPAATTRGSACPCLLLSLIARNGSVLFDPKRPFVQALFIFLLKHLLLDVLRPKVFRLESSIWGF